MNFEFAQRSSLTEQEMLRTMIPELTQADLKAIGRNRGFGPESIASRELMQHVFLSEQGVVSAIAELTPLELMGLHLLFCDPRVNAVKTLEALSGRPLPANVREELEDWAGHSEKFVLYEGFGLLEGQHEAPSTKEFVVEIITPNLALVRKPLTVYQRLETAEQVPIRIHHAEKELATPAEVKSRLSPSATPRRAPSKKGIKLKRSVQTTLWFADAEAHAAFAKILLDAKCGVPIDRRALTVCYAPKAEPLIKECMKKFNQEYAVTIEEVED